MEVKQFLNQLEKCVAEYRKLDRQCGEYMDDVLHFFNPALMKFLNQHRDEIGTLLGIPLTKSFQDFVSRKVYQEDPNKRRKRRGA